MNTPLLTIFTAPKPFVNPHIVTIQRNAIASWKALGPMVSILLIGDEPGIQAAAADFGADWVAQVRRNSQGTPFIPALFEAARQRSAAPLLAYVNADILLMPDFVAAAERLAAQLAQFLLVGQRWDLDVRQPLDFSGQWQTALRQRVAAEGRLHPRGGSDYFVFPRSCYTEIPDLVVGRAGWDNWMLFEARRRGWPLVDGTADVLIVHQDHDYSHLPGGKPHYRQPETFENIRLAGGRWVTRFTLLDCDRRLVGGRLFPCLPGWEKFWREVEIWPVTRLRSVALGRAFYALFHPRRAWQERKLN
ncbi:MAG: hypothetical protein KA988_01805 [Longilinea sp.]|nr:hypothetical protein [Longilinea sp.]MCA1954614.1 glycosyltransferase family 2 protein [Anaerolinea sp.]